MGAAKIRHALCDARNSPWPRAVSLLYRTRCVAVGGGLLAVELSEVALAACTLHGLAQSFLRVQICMFSFAAKDLYRSGLAPA